MKLVQPAQHRNYLLWTTKVSKVPSYKKGCVRNNGMVDDGLNIEHYIGRHGKFLGRHGNSGGHGIFIGSHGLLIG